MLSHPHGFSPSNSLPSFWSSEMPCARQSPVVAQYWGKKPCNLSSYGWDGWQPKSWTKCWWSVQTNLYLGPIIAAIFQVKVAVSYPLNAGTDQGDLRKMTGQALKTVGFWLGKPSNFATHSLEFIERGLLKTKHIPETSSSESLRVSGRPDPPKNNDLITSWVTKNWKLVTWSNTRNWGNLSDTWVCWRMVKTKIKHL